jgi:hypothetical protein
MDNSPAAEPFDVNFCFPVRELENDKIKLTPYIVCTFHLDATDMLTLFGT